jgi:dipeptidyl aminopeptidase/acylaminoacyl peptidase
MTRHPCIDRLADIARPEQPALSPDARHVAYVLRTTDVEADRTRRDLWWTPTGEAVPRQLTRGGSDGAPAWSPDGSAIAFLRSTGGVAQVWILPVDGGDARQVTRLPAGAGAPVWSPDGARLAFAAPVETASGEHDAPVVIDHLDYQADGSGFVTTVSVHLHVLDLTTGECRQVTTGDRDAGAPAWSPDGRTLAFTAGHGPDADLSGRVAVHVLDVDDVDHEPRVVGLADGAAATVDWSWSGDALHVTGYPGDPVGHLRLLRLPLDGGTVTDLATGLDRNVMPGGPGYPGGLPQLADDGRTLVFCARDRGCTQVYGVPSDGGLPRALVGGDTRDVAGLSVRGTTIATVVSGEASFGEVVVLDLATGTETIVTDHGATMPRRTHSTEAREFVIDDGTVVHGWQLRDPDAPRPGPLLLDVHGGPHNAWSGVLDDAHLYHQELVARGWTVLLLNPRGSDGYGEQFFGALGDGWGTADAEDFLQPVEQLVREGIADPDALAVSGYSYGGFMTAYLTSHDDRFSAAVAGGMSADVASLVGTSDLGYLMSEHELAGPPWRSREATAASSPTTHVDDVRTPTLVLHGGDDLRCPVGQAQQWFSALRQLRVPARLVIYPGASHLFILEGRPSHRLDYQRRLVDWVEQHATGGGGGNS